MLKQHTRRCRRLFTGLLFLVLIFGLTVHADAAWKKNSNGTYSYYSNGKKLKSTWIDNTYYVNSNGIRQKGWLQLKGKWYYFSASGKVVKKNWIKSSGKMYYAGPDGALLAKGRYKIGDFYYGFNKRGLRLSGKKKLNGQTYFFSKSNGRMIKNKWCKTGDQYYYYGNDGVLVTNAWVNRYYVGKNGTRLTKIWKDDRYLGSNGKAVKGLKKIDGSYYYFDTETYKKVSNTELTIEGVKYHFDNTGKGTVMEGNIPKATCAVEDTYYSDPDVEDDILLAAIIYREAGNQPRYGKLAVGLVIMNRVNSTVCPNTIREVIYQKSQFTPARGILTAYLKDPSKIPEECKEIAGILIEQFKSYKAGQKVVLKVEEETIDFPYMFFMTPKAYAANGLRSSYKQLGDHVFFEKWIR